MDCVTVGWGVGAGEAKVSVVVTDATASGAVAWRKSFSKTGVAVTSGSAGSVIGGWLTLALQADRTIRSKRLNSRNK